MRVLLASLVLLAADASLAHAKEVCEVHIDQVAGEDNVRRYDSRMLLVAVEHTTSYGDHGVQRFSYDRAGRLVGIDSRSESKPYDPPHGPGRTGGRMRSRATYSHDRAGRLVAERWQYRRWDFRSIARRARWASASSAAASGPDPEGQ